MGKRGRTSKSTKFQFDEDQEKESNPISSSDDEANEDLSLKIVEKARLRSCTSGQSNGALAVAGDPEIFDVEADLSEDVKIKRKSKKLKKKKPKMDSPEEPVVVVTEEGQITVVTEEKEVKSSSEPTPVETPDNAVLRKLLRGPRYFDPPDSSWGACYNCGEEGHTTANCTSARRRKPCFVCGSLEHNAKQCTKGRECFICKKGGHRAKECSEKVKAVTHGIRMCLKCGNTGHDMFSCTDAYSTKDLEGIQCYVCMKSGHLCCVDVSEGDLGEPSCYRCGQLGHIGSDCSRQNGKARTESHNNACYKCGEDGHFARECASSTKVRKKNLESSAPTRKISSKTLESFGARSLPPDIGKARKRKKSQYEGEYSKPSNSKKRGGWHNEDPQDVHYVDSRPYERGFSTPPNLKKRGGWVTEDPQYYPQRDDRMNAHRSPVTPNNARNRNYTATPPPSHFMGSDSYRNNHSHNYGNSVSNGASRFQQQRYQSPMYGNFSNDGTRRNYEW